MPKKLAMTMAGAVSLGSYEAGVLYEVLDAIQQHNTNSATSDDDKIVIDVVTGASAGGMTATILAQKLLYNADEFKGPYDNPLYNVWVNRISLAGLQATQGDEPALDSLFSSDLIEAISREELTARYTAEPPPAQKRHISVTDQICVGMALTNLNGVAYGYQVIPSGRFVYLDYSDQITRTVDAAKCDRKDFWEPLRAAAVACGAFPVAFRPQDLKRSAKSETADFPPDNLILWPEDPATFTYTDGGVLQNQPLGMAKNLVDAIDDHLETRRYYLFVSPHAKDPQANDTFRAAAGDYLHLFERLIPAVIGQAGFKDWITAQGLNEKVALLDERADDLMNLIRSGSIDVKSLMTTTGAILPLLFRDPKLVSPGANRPESLEDARNRIAKQYSQEMSELGDPSAQSVAFRDAVLAFETTAELGARDFMAIYGVTATDQDLAGAGLQSFVGFFDQRFRDHDYDVGRSHAQRALTDPAISKGCASQPVALGPLNYEPTSVRPIDPLWNGLPLWKIPADDVQAFRDGIKKRVYKMLDEAWGEKSVLLRPMADGLLHLLLDRIFAMPVDAPTDEAAKAVAGT
jgi:Patatin-like phospholipase